MSNSSYPKINVTGTVALTVASLLFLVLTSCAKPHRSNEDTPLNSHVAQIEAEAVLKDANELAKR